MRYARCGADRCIAAHAVTRKNTEQQTLSNENKKEHRCSILLKNKKAIIFDLDGTLVNSMWVWHDIDIEYLGRYGYEVPSDLVLEIEGMGFTETAAYFKKRFAIPDTIEEIKTEWNRMAFEKYATAVPLKTGLAGFLKKIREAGLKVGIASSNSRELIMACLKNHQIDDCFDCITTSCDVAKGKPAPDIYLHVAKTLGVEPAQCLVFEDVPMGILAGKNAGMQVCAVEDDHSKDQREEKRRLADFYITSYDEISEGTYEVLS